MKQYTYLDLGFKFIPSGKKHQGIGNLINKLWFILQQFLYKSEGKTVSTYLTFIDSTFKSVVLYACESWEDCKDQKKKLYLLFCKKILGVKNNTSSSKVLGELGQFPFRITI